MSDPADINADQSPVADLRQKFDALRSERPEVIVGAAFVGGIVLAMVLRRIGGH